MSGLKLNLPKKFVEIHRELQHPPPPLYDFFHFSRPHQDWQRDFLRNLKKDTNHQGITIDTLSEAQVDSEICVNLENADSYEEKDR